MDTIMSIAALFEHCCIKYRGIAATSTFICCNNIIIYNAVNTNERAQSEIESGL